MEIYIYDKTFEGFLSVVFYAFETKTTPFKIMQRGINQSMLFSKEIQIVTELEKSERVWNGLLKKINKKNADMIYRVFLSELPDVELLLLNYIQLVFSYKRSVFGDFGNPIVAEVHDIHKRVSREAEHTLMFVRFKKTADNIYFAPFEPKYNVLPISIKHFKDRFADQKWVIYDTIREYGYYYNLFDVQEIRFVDSNISRSGDIDKSILNTEELVFQDLWKNYFKSVSIKERSNKRLQMHNMPKRFWKHLTEMQ